MHLLSKERTWRFSPDKPIAVKTSQPERCAPPRKVGLNVAVVSRIIYILYKVVKHIVWMLIRMSEKRPIVNNWNVNSLTLLWQTSKYDILRQIWLYILSFNSFFHWGSLHISLDLGFLRFIILHSCFYRILSKHAAMELHWRKRKMFGYLSVTLREKV